MNMPIEQFLDIVTYNKLFNYVHMPAHIGLLCVQDDPEHKICFVEPVTDETCTIWYPIESWIDECKRRQAIDFKIECMREERYRNPNPTVKQYDVTELSNKLIQAYKDDDREAIQELTKQLEALT